MDYVEGFENKNKDSDLTIDDKEKLISELFNLNGYVNNEYKKYIIDLSLNNFHSIQGQKINRKFNLSSSLNSKVVKGKLVDVFFRASPIDLSNRENQLRFEGQYINNIKLNDLTDKTKITNAILKYFIILNKNLNLIKINKILLKSGTAINKNKPNAGNMFNITIEAASNQNDIKNEEVFKFQGFFINGV
ncbi:hypothetical protein SCORR_v1c05860 [Spiroplasma corruscae]|uniref:Uncharacterized protein n=1 Tax=Spiroplasma corruscae TaxID=216934 RepID=A0A222EPB4_9MOLU|nr:hypothetical protein [Spiroplasma corruscae]ASP28358.1 hypothetical protein SCORR_v1c05860 [Spiroplasma corruscae]